MIDNPGTTSQFIKAAPIIKPGTSMRFRRTNSATLMHGLSIKQYLLRGGSWALTGRLLTALMGLVLSAILARLLTPEDMGSFFLAFNLATFFAIVSRFGLENTLLRFISEALTRHEYKRVRELIVKGLLLAVLINLAVFLIFYLYLGNWLAGNLFSSESLSPVIGLVAIWLVFLSFQFLLAEIFRAFQDIREATIFGGLLTAIITAALLSGLWITIEKSTLTVVLFWILLAAGFNLILGISILQGHITQLPRKSKNGQKATYVELLNNSWPLVINAILLFVLSQSALWILAMFRPDEEVAVYGAAARISLLLSMAFTVVNAVVLPLIAKLNAEGEMDRLEKILRFTATAAIMPAIPVLLFFVFFGGWVLDVVFGDYYRQGAQVLAILSIAQGVVVVCGSCGYVLIMTGCREALILITIVSVATGVGLGLMSAEQYGGVGVAVATSIAITEQQILMLIYTKLRFGIWTFVDPRSIKEMRITTKEMA